jgi:SAM-dependent methyltransferase
MAAVTPFALELRDPVSGEPLAVERSAEGEALVSSRARYPVIRGIPRFVAGDGYAASFSFEWNAHARTQLDAFRGDDSSERQFRLKTGFTPEDLAGRLVLDAGVGAGRFADVASRWGAYVAGVDLSYAVEAARRNFEHRGNVFIAQADIGALPFAPATFDVIFAIGVLHHTPDPRGSFMKLVPLLKPGGTLAVWVYPPDPDYLARKPWVRFVNRLPPRLFHEWCRWFVPWAQRRLDDPRVGLLRRAFPFSNQGYGLEFDILDTFDGYSPRYHSLHEPEEVEGWFRDAGLMDIRRPSGWRTCVRGRRSEHVGEGRARAPEPAVAERGEREPGRGVDGEAAPVGKPAEHEHLARLLDGEGQWI